jgi:formate dehydrogenase major subunit
MSYARLDQAGLQWPCPTSDHPGTPILHRDGFATGARAPLIAVDYRPTPERVSAEYPLLLTTGRSLYQFNAGTMTGRTLNASLRPGDPLEIATADAQELGLDDGDAARVTSRYGSTVLPVRINGTMRRGELFATFHDPEACVNAVTGPYRDRPTGAPEYKITAVRVQRQPPPGSRR